MRETPYMQDAFENAGQVDAIKGEKIVVIIGTDDAGGLAHADAVLLVPKN